MTQPTPPKDQGSPQLDICPAVASRAVPLPVTSRKRLILGLGNELLTDDAIGLRIAAALRLELASAPDTTIACSNAVGVALLDIFCGYDEVVLIDAIQTGKAEVGFVHEMTSCQLKAASGIAPHFMGIAEMLALGRELGLEVPDSLRIFAVEVEDPYTLGTRLSVALDPSVPALVKRIRDRLK